MAAATATQTRAQANTNAQDTIELAPRAQRAAAAATTGKTIITDQGNANGIYIITLGDVTTETTINRDTDISQGMLQSQSTN